MRRADWFALGAAERAKDERFNAEIRGGPRRPRGGRAGGRRTGRARADSGVARRVGERRSVMVAPRARRARPAAKSPRRGGSGASSEGRPAGKLICRYTCLARGAHARGSTALDSQARLSDADGLTPQGERGERAVLYGTCPREIGVYGIQPWQQKNVQGLQPPPQKISTLRRRNSPTGSPRP